MKELKDAEESNVFNLVLKLREEQLFIRSEKCNIQRLHKLIREKTQNVIQSSWVTANQRLLLYQRDATSQNFHKTNCLLKSEFIEAKKALGFQTAIKVGSLLQVLRTDPEQLAKWLIVGEQLAEDNLQYLGILQSIVNGIYACFVFPEDTKFMLVLLYELGKLQLLKSENPRRTLKQRTGTFSYLYFLFHEVLQTAKFFINAAFEIPILQLVAFTEYYLDVDPEKTTMRYHQNNNNLNSFNNAIEYRNEVVQKLAEFTNSFITSILENAYSFPKSIAWIVNHISKLVQNSFGPKEANAVVTDLIFTMYLCPVIVHPEYCGICGTQITEVTRHNLIQVGQILQGLALYKFEPPDGRLADVFALLNKSGISDFVDLILRDLEGLEEPPVESTPSISRETMLLTEQELNNLITFFQRIQAGFAQNDNFSKATSPLISIEDQLSSIIFPSSRDSSPKSNRPTVNGNSEYPFKKSTFFTLVNKNNVHSRHNSEFDSKNIVLIFPMDSDNLDPIGLLSEEKVLNMQTPDSDIVDSSKTVEETVNNSEEIKQQYSSFVDEGSIGNTSDNLEAISEAASNHSVASSLELENEDQNDNLSDMVSANVSGRGTPNISGRDTPSSQVNENDDRVLAEPRQADISQPQQPQISRQIRSEIDDKFCKFEIKKLLEGDETISIISETWSTDVLASDNETVDAGDSRLDRQSLQLVDQAIHEVPMGNILDISETQSESAWSTDVMASDTERLTEVDNDDAASVAQSDDAHSVARSDDTRSETDDTGSRRMSNASNSYVTSPPVANNIHYVNSNLSSPSAFQEYRKVEFKNGKIYTSEKIATQTDSNANNLNFKSLTLTDNTQVSTYTEHSSSEMKTSSRSSVITTLTNTRLHTRSTNKDNDLSNMAGPSGLNKRLNNLDAESDLALNYLKKNRNSKKYEDRPNEMLLSNLSLNSSSSGSSSNSFENKHSHNETSEQWENKQWLNSSGSSLNVTLTPSESTSELSVLSVNNLSNPGNILHKKSATMMSTRSLKPSVSTGAIPKSISFDMSVDKGLDDDHRSKRGSFFGKLRIGFRNRRGKSFRNQEDMMDNYSSGKKLSSSTLESPVTLANNIEDSDDILAKYRTKPFSEGSPVKENCDGTKSQKIPTVNECSNVDVNNSFDDIKKKLRLVLRDASEIPHCIRTTRISVKNKIETVLRLELGKARRLRAWTNVARISEAIRCINLLNDKNCLKLLKSMKEDILQRSPYIQYLVHSRQTLLICDLYLDSLMEQITCERQQCEEYLAVMCIQEFLLEQENEIGVFCEEFRQLSLADEKCDCLHNFYRKLFSIMNGSNLWQDVFRNKEDLIKVTLERFILSKVYLNSIYPNGDGDRHRDSVLQEHIAKLSKIITPDHKDLMIHKMFLREYPWQPAQDALKALDACRTPRDKVNCVVRCAKSIMDLLSLSQGRGSTTADDFTPVLVYVIIKVNPEALLSTVQFVNSFFHNQLSGEEEYWWTQFSAAVEYIKTMDYSD